MSSIVRLPFLYPFAEPFQETTHIAMALSILHNRSRRQKYNNDEAPRLWTFALYDSIPTSNFTSQFPVYFKILWLKKKTSCTPV